MSALLLTKEKTKTNSPSPSTSQSFDLFRLSRSKDVVDICSNTLRKFNREGLPFYRRGKATFVSKSELDAFIRGRA